MRHFRQLFMLVVPLVSVYAQSVGISGTLGRSNNRVARQSRLDLSTKSGRRDVVAFAGDTVIPQLVDGNTWKTSFIIRNLDSVSRHCQVLFFNDDGTDMYLPIIGAGVVRGMDLIINPGGTTFFETSSDNPTLSQRWASLLKDHFTDSVGGMAVFRQRRIGFPDAEAVVPIGNQFDGHFVLIFDNTNGYVTAMAIANPTLNSVVATAYIRDEFGNLIDQQTLSLNSYTHKAFSIPASWLSTVGRRGSIEFQTSGFGIGVLGLRFSLFGSFTSFHVLSNLGITTNRRPCWSRCQAFSISASGTFSVST